MYRFETLEGWPVNMPHQEEFAEFLNGYVDAVYFTDFVEGYAENPAIEDGDEDIPGCCGLFSIEAQEEILQDCVDFFFWNFLYIQDDPNQAGQGFWFTRNRHGSGFMDGHWPKNVDHVLTVAAMDFSEVHPYDGDDGFVYFG